MQLGSRSAFSTLGGLVLGRTAPRRQLSASAYQNIQTEVRDAVGLLSIHRPAALNALNEETTGEIVAALQEFDRDRTIGAIVLTGSDRAFAAGADIKEMANRNFAQVQRRNLGAFMDHIAAVRTPLIAAVRGYALGGGCELAMACDIAYAAEDAQFGQPEVQIGTIPGWGGTQRLLRAIGKARAMDMILTGRRISAAEAERWGLVAAVYPSEQLLPQTLETAAKIAALSQPVVQMAKAAVNAAQSLGLADGVRYERALFQATFALQDQKEGMNAFVDKREAEWTNG
ncbi:hypothetical protein CDCA_CDCA04G1224 [Cyanidium caldarium]|uniref:Probable enoyl-CoA hydratase, mitochondrial n=1 Tax=Cyanidium caldarium TaxID=2771 RepID=A0AAV9ISC2_CYACA|nr:hypothetical protein CDCA_CDCA04G1224 [Cyanidium caldarium]